MRMPKNTDKTSHPKVAKKCKPSYYGLVTDSPTSEQQKQRLSTRHMTQSETDRPGFDRRMNKDEINACPIARWKGPVSVVRTREELATAMRKLAGDSLLGFDTETRPAYTKGESYPPSLLQLANEKEVFIFQFKHLRFAKPLRDILADPAIIKAGVSLDYDIRELKKMSHFKAEGFVDLGDLAKKKGIKNHGLRGLAAVLLGCRIAKGAQTSNWARDVLTKHQIQYAATDAWIGRKLYLTLEQTIEKNAA